MDGVQSSKKECNVTYIEPNENEWFAEICKCKRVISPIAMYHQLNAVKLSGEYIVKCFLKPQTHNNEIPCNEIIPYDICAFVAQLTPNEEKEFHYALNENKLISPDKTLKCCPNDECGAYCFRPIDMKEYRVHCVVCKKPDWCWMCRLPWKKKDSIVTCGYECNPLAYNANLLLNCETTDIFGIKNVPILRACPQCLSLTEWIEQCKHVKCQSCKYDFCLSCLGGWTALGGNYHASESTPEKCPLKPCQIDAD